MRAPLAALGMRRFASTRLLPNMPRARRCACSPPWLPRWSLPTFIVATLCRRGGGAALSDHRRSTFTPSRLPVLGFLTFTVVFFLRLFPAQPARRRMRGDLRHLHRQAWNMAFSFYQSLRTVRVTLQEVSRQFQFSPWLRFWHIGPFAPMPGLVWNAP